jgi:hypothetical protein
VDIHRLVGFLEVVVAFIGFLLAFLVVRRPWVWGVFEHSPELVALLSGVVLSRCHGHFSFNKSLKPPEVFFELSFAGR